MGPTRNFVGGGGVKIVLNFDGQAKNKQRVPGLLAGWRHRVKLRRESKLEFTKQKGSQEKSEIWNNFKIAVDTEEKELELISCQKCAKVLMYNGHKSGTLRHQLGMR